MYRVVKVHFVHLGLVIILNTNSTYRTRKCLNLSNVSFEIVSIWFFWRYLEKERTNHQITPNNFKMQFPLKLKSQIKKPKK